MKANVYETFATKLEAEKERQKMVRSTDVTEVILNKLIQDIKEKDIYIEDIKSIYFYPVMNDYFGRSYSLGYAFTSTETEEKEVEKGFTNNNLHPIGKYGDVSKIVFQSFLSFLKERLQNEGLNITRSPFEDSFKIVLWP